MKTLHPGARWIFRVNFLPGFVMLFVFFIVIGTGAIVQLGLLSGTIALIFCILIPLVVLFPFAEIYARLAYKNWLYGFTDKEIRIEKGIIFKTYKSIPYQRIQNVDIYRGILARMCGFSAVKIQTAGYSYGGKGGQGAEGYLPAVPVETAEQIRNYILKKISEGRNLGL